MNIIREYINGNSKVAIYDDGTKVREYEGVLKPVHPESFDCKITNRCDGNKICDWCHEKSHINGDHADLNKLLEVIKDIPAGVEIACLHGDTMVHGENGSKPISSLKIGDRIYDSTNKLRTVINVTLTNKQAISIKGNKGFNVICSKDHPFIINGEKILAENLLNKKIDLLESIEYNEDYSNVKYDLAKFISEPSLQNRGGARGGKVTTNEVRLNHCSGWCNRYITLDNDLMWAYGLVVAEGSSKSVSLHKNEIDIANKFIEKYKSIFNRGCNIFIKNKSQTIEPLDSSIYKTLFFKLMNVGHGAHNKNLSFLYSINNKELIRSALYGLFQGNGCFRKRDNKFNGGFNLSLKTCSRFLAYDVLFLLNKHFGIKASISKGVNKVRKIEGRTLKESIYYMVEIYSKENILKLFPDVFNDNIGFQKVGTTKYSKTTVIKDVNISSIEESDCCDLYDITLDDSSSHIFPINGYVLTHNCGGGNPLSHPDLLPFLNELKSRGLIANMTVNEKHFKSYHNTIKMLIEEKLIYGLGVSISDSKYLPDIAPFVSMTSNLVFHVIMGVNNVEVIDVLKQFVLDSGGTICKILTLGYKEYGLGNKYYSLNKAIVDENRLGWYRRLALHFKDAGLTLSFDNLAIEQLKLKRFFTDKSWEKFYMGKEGACSMFVDAVKQQYAICSVDPNRVSFDDMSMLDFFQAIKR